MAEVDAQSAEEVTGHRADVLAGDVDPDDREPELRMASTGLPTTVLVEEADDAAANTDWNRVGFARYPNRRGFFRLMADPVYGKQSAYKLMGAHTNLIPMTPQWVVPDLRLMTGLVLLILFLAIGWLRAELRSRV